MKPTQAATNPFIHSDTNKRYYTYDYYLRRTFGTKCAKIPLDAGFTCPNRDGTLGTGGCIYCSGRGSGDFACSPELPIAEQYRRQREILAGKWREFSCIPYFQAHTNTYAPLERLKALFEEAVTFPDAVGLSIATRPDCLPDEVLEYLADLSERTLLTLELGLQTVHDETARRINRGYPFKTFLDAYRRIRRIAPRIRISAHLIFGLIGENDEMMVETVQTLAALRPDEVKLHVLYVQNDTEMARIYRNGGYFPMNEAEYVDLVVRAISMLPPDTVIGRLTGDGDRKQLLAPLWTKNKRLLLNKIDKKFYEANVWQGKNFNASFVNKP